MNTGIWSKSELLVLKRDYPDMQTKVLAEALGRTEASVSNKAFQLGIKKSKDYLASQAACRFSELNNPGKQHRFKKGNVPFNKNLVGWRAGGRSVETQFKPGHAPHNTLPIGTERINKEGHLERKVNDTGNKKKDWKRVAEIIWVEARGSIPTGHILAAKNGDRFDICLENLEVISRSENMKRNSVHRYPKELAEICQLKGALQRQINKRKNHENQN